MIFVTKLSGERYLLNHKLVETAQEKPDTTLTMVSGKKIIIKESLEELFNIVKNYERTVNDFSSVVIDGK